ncbi:hypothetical protein [Pseudoroseicyclus tamaricis]|uniref:Response regulator receiver domain-containing protein n=1 Tax=Pseudoroseicyclus tamaricis TaxID=2705421 RepID=A0A6B2JPB8_9RHOB|nr:hypothetical protein [Pseudoroseicyclus tamaricis]NDU99784.1 hypothetical protein [Pseudoroseicyclus tamaricis]
MATLAGQRILIVDGDDFVAADLAHCLEQAGAQVLGPVATLQAAAELAPDADAAVLDILLDGTLVYPLADELLGHGVPFVFYAGGDPAELPPRFRSIGRLRKPDMASQLMQLQGSELSTLSDQNWQEDPLTHIPKLRLMARLAYDDAAIADRVVERTLQLALEMPRDRDDDMTMEEWLRAILVYVINQAGPRLLN